MRADKFHEIVNATPIMVPVFTVTRPVSVEGRVVLTKGTYVYINRSGLAVSLRTGVSYSISPGYLKFIEYRNLNGVKRKV